MNKYNFKTVVVGIFVSLIAFCISSDIFSKGISDVNRVKTKENVSGSSAEFQVKDGLFMMGEKPFVIKAAELHYPRIPEEYWENRIQLCKSLGMNTVCLYVFWNYHESNENEFDFTGNGNLRKFIELCDENDLKVILRPGPYVCAEWEMGGLPWWLLKKKDIELRENDPYFLERVDKFQEAVASQVKDLTSVNGGPIIMIQVENEYGSYGENKDYVSNIRDILKKYYGDEVVMFQCDWASNFTLNGLDDLLWTMNFGTGADIDSQFAALKEMRPESPLMCSEFWSGWFDKWGAGHETRSADEMISGIDEMLSKNISFSLYMTHGGTNWGHWAGANSPGYAPDVTSYDYDAPINEYGQPTDKYWKLREVMKKYAGNGELSELPEITAPVKIERFRLTKIAPLFSNLPQPIKDSLIHNMEYYDQGYGSILYSTFLPEIPEGTVLRIDEPHDFAQVFVDSLYMGSLDRRLNEKELTLPSIKSGSELRILVEATGRINFGRAIKDFKGITEKVVLINEDKEGKLVETDLKNWEVYLLPDNSNFYNSLAFSEIDSLPKEKSGRLPIGVYKGKFNVEKAGDTFLDMSTWGKGLVYVNGHGLGRFWEIGPQQTLYMPGVWLKEGENDIVVFDVVGPRKPVTAGLDQPVLDVVLGSSSESTIFKDSSISIPDMVLIMEGEFENRNGWQEFKFEKPVESRYFAIEAINPLQTGETSGAIAELYLLDKEGNRLSRENWIVSGVSSVETEGNHTVEKAFDLQESTYWQSANGKDYPHYIIIDLGEPYEISGFQYLPRMEKGVPGGIKKFKIYL